MPITTLLDVRCPSFRLTGHIDMPVCYAHIDDMKLLHDYYQFCTIELQIDSPGGSADALHCRVLSLREGSKKRTAPGCLEKGSLRPSAKLPKT